MSNVEETYNALSSTYDERYNTKEALQEDSNVFQVLNKNLHPNVLDLGCGTGLALDYLSVKETEYLGTDLSQNMLNELLLKHPKIKTLHCDLNSVSLKGFNTIISLYGSASYLSPSLYKEVTQAPTYMLMVYKPGYLPDYYTEDLTQTDYSALKNTFKDTYEWHNFIVASNIKERLK